jgi:hypothetical protein
MDELQRRKELLGVYERVAAIVWQRLSPTFGIRTVNALARNVVARQAKRHPDMTALKVGPNGLEWAEIERKLMDIEAEELRRMLDDFIDEFFEALATLIGKLVVGKIFKEASELAREGRE